MKNSGETILLCDAVMRVFIGWSGVPTCWIVVIVSVYINTKFIFQCLCRRR